MRVSINPNRVLFISAVVLLIILTCVPAASAGVPVFSEQTPAPDSVAPSFRPEISVYVKDDVDISRSFPVMTVNGVKVSCWYTPKPLKPTEGRVTCYPSYQTADLPLGVNTVSVSFKNSLGETGTTTWSFNVQAGPQITNFTPRFYSEVYTRPFIIRADVTSPVGIRSAAMTLDGKTLRTTFANSQILYNPTLWDPVVPNGPHTVQVIATDNAGVTNTVTWRFTCEFWVDDDRSNAQCTSCHTGFPAPNHPITGYCNDCHRTIPVLSAISWQPGYTHDPGYISAWECTYCHDPRFAVPRHPADIDTYHNAFTSLDPNCGTCHLNSVTQEHLSNPKTQTQTLTCNTCHNATITTNPPVYQAVDHGNLQCAACHSLAHKMNLGENINSDIPFYEGFNWSQPISTVIFYGEPWIPGEFASTGKIVFSNRRSDVNGDAVFNFYKDALTGKGWVLESPTPELGSNFFTAIFSKGKHKAAIMFDNREYHSLSSPAITSGFRITISYY